MRDKNRNAPDPDDSDLVGRKHESFEHELRRFYLHGPLIRFMASYPVCAGGVALVGGFGVLVLINLWAGTLMWANSENVANSFLSQPADWIFVMLANPIGIALLGTYYDRMWQSVSQLVNEGLINERIFKDRLQSWKEIGCGDRCYELSTLTLVGVCVALFLTTFPEWMPGVSCWYLSKQGNTLSVQGIVMLVLAVCEMYVLFTYLSDTIRFYLFHKRLTDTPSSPSLVIIRNHPDEAFGYAPLALPMNCAIAVALVATICIATFVVGPVDAFLSNGAVSLNSMFIVEVVLAILAVPWIVFGPVWPFVSMLQQQKADAIKAIRVRISKEREQDLHAIINEFESWQKGVPLIINKRSSGVLAVTMVLPLAAKAVPLLLKLTHLTTSIH